MTGKVLRWKLSLQDKDFHLMHVPGKEVHQFVPDALPRLCENNMPPKALAGDASSTMLLAAMEPTFHIPPKIFKVKAESTIVKLTITVSTCVRKGLKPKGS